MKTLAIGLMLGASLASTAASASDQRPTYKAFAASRATAEAPRAILTAPQVAPATPRVAKRQKAIGSIPLYVPLLGAVGLAGLIVAVSSGSNGSPG